MIEFLRKKVGFRDLNFRSDCHCHLLPGVDDGIATREESFRTLEAFADAGISTVTFTPHVNPELFPGNEEWKLKQQFNEYLEALPDSIASRVNLSLGAEYMVYTGFENRDPHSLLQFRPGEVLIEMSYMYPSPTLEQTIFNIRMAGLKPVLAHPERYTYLAGHLDSYDKYHDMGAGFQMNLMSLAGVYGPASVKILEYLLGRGWYTYLGTDTHSLHHIQTIQVIQFPAKYLKNLKNV